MSQIINGLHIDINSDELKELLLGRLKYHQAHKNQCIYYKFMAEHVVPSATYRLDEHALVRLGIQASHY